MVSEGMVLASVYNGEKSEMKAGYGVTIISGGVASQQDYLVQGNG